MKNKAEYLEKLISLAKTVKINPTKSLLLQALELPSSQSIVIQMGNRLELFWVYVIQSMKAEIDTSKSTRQIDLAWKDTQGNNYYAESKCNWDLDTDKMPATLRKIDEQANLLDASGICFCPVTDKDIVVRSQKIRGVNWILNTLGITTFTSDDYFSWLRTDVRKVI